MTNQKRILGQGLSALISSNSPIVKNLSYSDNFVNTEIFVSEIEPNPWQPRKTFDEAELYELKESILEHGVIQPISLRQKDNKYQIIAGERRWQASKLAGKLKIPAVILAFNDKQMLEVALVENLQRLNLNAIEEAKAFKMMIDEYAYTQKQVSIKVGKSRSYIANSVRLLSLPQDIQDKIVNRKLSASHARTLIGKEDASQRASEMIVSNMNVRDAERINSNKEAFAQANSNNMQNLELLEIADALSSCLNMKIKIVPHLEGGSVNISFNNSEELDMLVQRLMNVNSLFEKTMGLKQL